MICVGLLGAIIVFFYLFRPQPQPSYVESIANIQSSIDTLKSRTDVMTEMIMLMNANLYKHEMLDSAGFIRQRQLIYDIFVNGHDSTKK